MEKQRPVHQSPPANIHQYPVKLQTSPRAEGVKMDRFQNQTQAQKCQAVISTSC